MPYGDGIVTDRDLVVAEGTFPTMALDTPTTDPTFGLTYTVIADNTFQGGTVYKPSVEYPHLSPFNADSTKVWIDVSGAVWVADWNPTTMLASNWEEMTEFRAESFYFSRTDPDVAYSVDRNTQKKILKRNFATDTTTTYKDFTGLIAGGGALKQMAVSEDTDDTFAFTYNDGTNEKDYLVYRKSTDTILVQERMSGDPDLNECHINDTGEYLIAYGYDNKGRILRFSGAGGTTITRWELGDLWSGGLNAGVAGTGHSDYGREYIVGTDADGLHIFRSKWSDLLTSLTAFRDNSIQIYDGSRAGGAYNNGMHIGYRGNDKDWAVVSFYDIVDGTWEVTTNEICLVKVNIPDEASKQIQRFQKGRGERGPGAWDYTEVYKAGGSYDGRFAAFTTNNKVTGRSYVLVTKISDGGAIYPTTHTGTPVTRRRMFLG